MNNPRLLIGSLTAILWGGLSVLAQSDRVFTLEEIFQTAENNSVRLKASLSAETVADYDLATAKAARLPELSASLSLGYNGNGFTTARDFSDYQKAPIPHLNNIAGVSVTQPVYAGGAINGAIELETLKSSAARTATELNRDNIRFRLAGYYLDIYKYSNLRSVVCENIANARQALVINGFMGAVCGAAFGPAVIGELFEKITARNFALLSSGVTDTVMWRKFSTDGMMNHFGEVFRTTQLQAMMVSMKEIYGWLLIGCIICIIIIALSYCQMRPWAIFPKWRTVRKVLRRESRETQGAVN